MRIGIDASNLRAGGGLTHITELLKFADPVRHGFRQIIVWGGKQTLQRLPSDKNGLKLIHEPLLDKNILSRFYWQKTRLSVLARQNCDLLFVPGGLYTGNFTPAVTMSRNMLPFEYKEMRRYGLSPTFFRLLLLRYSQSRTFKRAAGLIFLTNYARSVVKDKSKINGVQTIIPHGIDFRFHQSPGVQKSIDAYPPALRCLKQTLRKIDPEKNFIQYHGAVPYSQLPDYYHKADAFIFASSCENMPNILLEAMASGLPIACSSQGPMPEILEDGGVYFNPEVPDELADTLCHIIENPALREQCAWSAFHKSQEYSWERCADENIFIFKKSHSTC